MKRHLLLLLFLVAGCVQVPFRQTAPDPLPDGDAGSIVDRFRANVPASFHLLNSVVFEYNSRKFSAIGTMEMATREGTFKVAGMNPMGVKLFELSGDRDHLTTDYVIGTLGKYGDITAAIGNDIRRIYLDLVPSADATVWKRGKGLAFRQPSGAGFLEYVFAGAHGDLVEKNYYEGQGIVWRASYYEYRDQGGKRLPQGVVFLHYDYHYRLTIRNKEFRFENN